MRFAGKCAASKNFSWLNTMTSQRKTMSSKCGENFYIETGDQLQSHLTMLAKSAPPCPAGFFMPRLFRSLCVTPAEAGAQLAFLFCRPDWTPACAGVTE
jgi:hypothetical protein